MAWAFLFCFFNLFIHFNWRQLLDNIFGGFCHTPTCISHGCTCVHHPKSPSHLPPHRIPLGWSQSTGFECPVSCIKLGLVIYFTLGNIHVSVLFCQMWESVWRKGNPLTLLVGQQIIIAAMENSVETPQKMAWALKGHRAGSWFWHSSQSFQNSQVEHSIWITLWVAF